jgi:hypothetical protein
MSCNILFSLSRRSSIDIRGQPLSPQFAVRGLYSVARGSNRSSRSTVRLRRTRSNRRNFENFSVLCLRRLSSAVSPPTPVYPSKSRF